jgi:hypothetical protein
MSQRRSLISFAKATKGKSEWIAPVAFAFRFSLLPCARFTASS